MVVMASDGPSPHPSSLRLGLPTPQPSRLHHAQSLLGPSFHHPRTHHVLESHPERAALLSRLDDERCHTIGSHSALALRLYLAACNPSSSYVSVLLCFIKPILGNRYVRCRGFIVSEPRETHPQSEIADVPTYPVPPMITWGVWNLDPHPPP